MTNEEICEKILNKKFQKSVFTGYDTIDVDKFFDFVIEHLKQNDKDVEKYKQSVDNLQKDNEKLKQALVQKNAENAKLSKIIKQYEDDGYNHISENKRKQEELNKKGAQ